MAEQSTDPIRLSFNVDCDPEHAFDVWTARTTMWWPKSHSISTEPDLEVVLEPRVGGRIYERLRSGTEHDWGRVVAWEPPSRLVYEWHLRQDLADATEVEIRFKAADTGTEVEIEHRGWERLGARGPARREGNFAGWGGLLPHFVKAAEAH